MPTSVSAVKHHCHKYWNEKQESNTHVNIVNILVEAHKNELKRKQEGKEESDEIDRENADVERAATAEFPSFRYLVKL